MGVHGVSKENASAKQAEKCCRNHRTHPYAKLRHRSDLCASCSSLLKSGFMQANRRTI
jgi:hypothetical protein